MHTTTIRHGNERRLGLAGRLTADRHDEGLPDITRRMLGQGARRILLDMGGVSYMDSTCLGEIIAAYCAAEQCGAELRLINVPPRVRHLLDISGLATLFLDPAERGGVPSAH